MRFWNCLTWVNVFIVTTTTADNGIIVWILVGWNTCEFEQFETLRMYIIICSVNLSSLWPQYELNCEPVWPLICASTDWSTCSYLVITYPLCYVTKMILCMPSIQRTYTFNIQAALYSLPQWIVKTMKYSAQYSSCISEGTYQFTAKLQQLEAHCVVNMFKLIQFSSMSLKCIVLTHRSIR